MIKAMAHNIAIRSKNGIQGDDIRLDTKLEQLEARLAKLEQELRGSGQPENEEVLEETSSENEKKPENSDTSGITD